MYSIICRKLQTRLTINVDKVHHHKNIQIIYIATYHEKKYNGNFFILTSSCMYVGILSYEQNQLQ